MYQHALAILEVAESWEWPIVQRIQQSGEQGGKYKAITTRLLYHLIIQSQALGGTVLGKFWTELGECHPKLKENIDKLRLGPQFTSSEQTLRVLLDGIDRKKVNFQPIFMMAAEYLTHLGVAFANTGGRGSGIGTPHSVTDIVSMETDELLQSLKDEKEYGKRKQEILKALSFKRDGILCLLTGFTFSLRGLKPILAHIIPHSVHHKPDTLKCIAMFAGDATRDLVVDNLNSIGNAMNLESNAHTAYDDLQWGIEAQELEDGKTVKYIYRNIPSTADSPEIIRFRDGDEIKFGKGTDGKQLGGPLPFLCNLHLAVARVLNMSGAAELIAQWKDDADDSDFPHVYLASEDFCEILDAQLLLSGRALIA